jgi:large subunit ribosomal protein L23
MKNKHDLYDVILKPVMSEKSNILTAENKYTFFVDRRSDKSLITKSVEFIFNVKVSCVNIVNLKSKKVRFKGVKGSQAARKKAVVTLADGFKIDLTSGL